MRFYAHDGQTTHGPAGVEELMKLPGFDGDTLVCPVGSDDSADWKPALSYAPFKRALLEPPAESPALAPLGAPAPALSPMLASLAPKPVSRLSPLAPIDSPKMNQPTLESPKTIAVPAESPKTSPCPGCAHPNLESARFCNACGARMDGSLTGISSPPVAAPVSEPAPEPAPVIASTPVATPPPAPAPVAAPMSEAAPAPAPTPAPIPVWAPEPAPDPFAHLDPMRTFPLETEPAPRPEPARRPLQPGKMGQLGAFEETAPADPFVSPPAEPERTAMAVPVWKRPMVLSAVAGAAVIAAGLAYWLLGRNTPPETVAELNPSLTTSPPPLPETTPAAPIYSTPPETSSPSIPAPRASKSKKISKLAQTPPAARPTPADKPKRPRRARALRAAKQEPAEAPAKKAEGTDSSGQDPLLEALLGEATSSSPEPAGGPAAEPVPKPAEKSPAKLAPRPAAKPSQFSLPGLQRPVSASDRAPSAAAAPSPAETGTPPIAGLADPLAEPGKTAPPPGIENEAAKPAEGDQVALIQVHEQFDFCAQLLNQGAYGDHYDTCLCKDAREAAPYHSRRGYYVTAKKKEAGSGQLETTAKIISSKIDGGVAQVTARWKAGADDKGRTAAQTWKLEDGLWCQAP